MKKKKEQMNLEFQQRLNDMNKQFEILMNNLQSRKLEELNQRRIQTENILQEQRFYHDIEMNRIRQENFNKSK